MNRIQQNQNGLAKFITDLPQTVLLLTAVCRICGSGTDRREKSVYRNRTQKSSRYIYESDVCTKQI